jgi:hypothetical protein
MLRPRFWKRPETTWRFRIARDLGMTVAELDLRMTRAEMTQWIAYYRYEMRERERAAREAEKQRKG